MRHAVLAALVLLAAIPALAQGPTKSRKSPATAAPKAWTPPRTEDGQPDLQGVWLNVSATPVERPDALAGRSALTDDEVRELQARADRLFKAVDSDFAVGDALFLAALANLDRYKNPNATAGADSMLERTFDNRTSLVVDPPDGKIPPLTPEGRKRQAADVAARVRSDPDGPEDLNNDRRCITFGLPRLGRYGTGPYSYSQILQAPGYVVLNMEFVHEARIIPLDGRPHIPASIRQWNGDSRGRWEGHTLVVDTTNFSAQSNFMGSAENLRLVERFTRVAPDAIAYEVTVTDPTTWTKPWTAAVRLTQSRDKLFEAACHEGNFYLVQSTLAVARAGERAAAEQDAKKPKK